MVVQTSQFRVAAILLGALLLYAGLQTFWLVADERPAVELRDFERIAQSGHALRGDSLGKAYPSGSQHVRHSPLLSAWTVPFLATFGCTVDVAVLSLLPFALLLVVAAYQISLRYLSPLAAAVSAILVLAFHHFAVVEPLYPAYSFTKEFKPDLPLSALVAATCWGMLVLRERTSRRAIVVVGLTMAAGFLTRISFPVFVAILGVALWCDGMRKVAVWRRIAWAGVLAACVSAPWYLVNAPGVIRYFAEREVNVEWALHTGMPRFLSLDNLMFYVWGIRNMVSVLALAFAALGILCMYRKRSRGMRFSIAGLLIAYGVLTLLPGKSVRFMIPLLVLIALPIASLVDAERGRLRRGLAALILLLMAGFRMLCLNGVIPGYYDPSGIDPEELAPLASDWRVGDILDDAIEAKHDDSVLRIAVVPFVGHFRHDALVQAAIERGVRIRRESGWMMRGDAWMMELAEAEFLVTKSGANGPSLYVPYGADVERWLATPAGKVFAVLGRYALPDGSEATLYQRADPSVRGWSRLPEGEGGTEVLARFGDAIVLRSLKAWRERDHVCIRCEWEAERAPAKDYRLFIQLRTGLRSIRAEAFVPACGSLPTGLWQTGFRLEETYEIGIPENGLEYEIWIGWHRGWRRLSITDSCRPVFWRALGLGPILRLSDNALTCNSLERRVVPREGNRKD
ncbi:MAG: hypothetical protein HN341_16380 [Verrucomicrobia bacterium]|nr:hypothetical protein [Verrucomicrobiota bacterium]